MTRVLKLDPSSFSQEDLSPAVEVLRRGGLVAFPTETVYGLGARAYDLNAVRGVFAAKGRPRSHPLIVHVDSMVSAKALASEWPERAERLARAFWPGPLTLVVGRGSAIAEEISGGDSVALRSPKHALAQALIAALGEPVVAPSANRYQSISPTTAEHVLKSLGERVDLVVDGGACAAGMESTVVDVRGREPIILRLGALSPGALRQVEPEILVGPGLAEHDDARPSPGMDRRHYAPRVPLRILENEQEVREEALLAVKKGERPGLLVNRALAITGALEEVLTEDAELYAQRLYAALHRLEDAGAEIILVAKVPAGDTWAAVHDRLMRASARPASAGE